MASYRGFTVSFNSIGAGKSTRKYLLLACYELLTPLLNPLNKNMIEAKCCCQLIINTRAVFRKGAMDTWVKYQLVVIVAPTLGKHAQAKRMIESILPGSVILEQYRDTAMTRVQCNEFVPDNKPLVFSYHRNGITSNRYGEVYDLNSPSAPPKSKETNRPIMAAWHVTRRERAGVFLPTKNFPLQRRLNVIGLLEMLLLGVNREAETAARINQNRSNMLDAHGQARNHLTRRRPSAAREAAAAAASAAVAAAVSSTAAARFDRTPSISFGLQ